MDLFAEEQKVLDEAAEHIKMVESGAQPDFTQFVSLAKEYERMLRQIRKATRFSDRTTGGLFRVNIELADKVHLDELTGIYNRRYMEESLRRYIKTLSRSDGILSIMMIDIDFFKKYNDAYGHSDGDICLRDIAQTLTGCVTREDDFVARYGGEEFAVILPHTDENGAHLTANRILEAVRARDIEHRQSSVAEHVTVSIGVTTVKAKHTHNPNDYIKRADKALYTSKHEGRDRYTFVKYGLSQE